uniref:G-protein coupled receptors family 1 profile domain-containing protein n=1 Tax=Ciona savignyi TaxID=51511 RepID=H2YV36_CIOSA
SETDLISNAVLRAIFWIMGILALCGNSVVFVTTAIKWQRSSLTPVKRGFLWFILNLSLSDALMSIYLLGISTQGALLKGNYIQNDYRWRSSNICTALGSLALLSSEACVFLMAVMTTFRLASVYFPFYMSDCSGSWYKFSTSIAWLCAAIITVIPIGQFDSGYFINAFGYFGDTSVCMPKLFVKMGDVACEYSMFLVILNLVMFMYMAICYLLIYKVSTRATTTRITGECKKLQKRIVILVVTDFCCWVPVCVMAC